MLASFGFSTGSREAAAHTHSNCDCRIVPQWGGDSVDGYDPDEMYGRYNVCLDAIGGRDPEWFMTGKVPDVLFSTNQVKGRVSEAELRTASRLAAHGIKPMFIQDYEWVVGEGGRKRKVGFPDLENGIEIKTLGSSGSAFGAMGNYLENSAKKKGIKCVVVDNSESARIADDDLVKAGRKIVDSYPSIPHLRLLLKSGVFLMVK